MPFFLCCFLHISAYNCIVSTIKILTTKITNKVWCKYSLLIVCLTFLFLFSPKPKTATGTYCGEYIKVSKLGFVLFCDSYQYVFLTTNPSLLLDSNFVAVRQNRPLYIYAAHVIGLPIKFITSAFIESSFFKKLGGEKYLYQESINQKLESSPFLKMYKIDQAKHHNLVVELLPFYIAFLIMNFLILLSSLVLFEKLLTQLSTEKYIIHFLSLFIASSGIVKAFFFSAHEQMFAFFTPISIAYVVYLFLNDKLSPIKLLFVSFGMGLLCLAYGSFILYYPCLGIAFLVKQKSLKISFKMITTLLPGAILFVLPTLSWMYICYYFSGHYFNGEIETFREIIWIKDTLSKGILDFLAAWASFSLSYLHTVLITLTPFVVGIYILYKQKNELQISSENELFYYFLQWMFILFFVFFWMLGYYNFRLTYTSVPILLLLIALLLQNLIDNKKIDTIKLQKRLRLLAVIWVVWSVIKYGPFPFQ